MTNWRIRPLIAEDAPAAFALHRDVTGAPNSGLAREADEITPDYIAGFVGGDEPGRIALGAFDGEVLLGEIHASPPGPRQFAHVLTDLTVTVHPAAQGSGVGSGLFVALFAAAAAMAPPIARIELVARSGNTGALRLYERLGFRPEGRFIGRVRLANGAVEDDIPMALLLRTQS